MPRPTARRTPERSGWIGRDSRLLDRALSPDEAAHFTHMARRIAELLALGTELDANYRVNEGVPGPG